MLIRGSFSGIGRHPRFHKKHSKQSSVVPQHLTIADSWLDIPKLKHSIKAKMHRPLGGKPKSLTIVKGFLG